MACEHEEDGRYLIGVGCTGCGQCKRVCPAGCIEGARGYVHVIRQDACLRCGACADTCPAGAIHLDD